MVAFAKSFGMTAVTVLAILAIVHYVAPAALKEHIGTV